MSVRGTNEADCPYGEIVLYLLLGAKELSRGSGRQPECQQEGETSVDPDKTETPENNSPLPPAGSKQLSSVTQAYFSGLEGKEPE